MPWGRRTNKRVCWLIILQLTIPSLVQNASVYASVLQIHQIWAQQDFIHTLSPCATCVILMEQIVGVLGSEKEYFVDFAFPRPNGLVDKSCTWCVSDNIVFVKDASQHYKCILRGHRHSHVKLIFLMCSAGIGILLKVCKSYIEVALAGVYQNCRSSPLARRSPAHILE